MNKLAITLLLAALLALLACSTTPVSLAPSIAPMGEKTVAENIGEARGESSAWSVLGLFMVGTPDISLAISSALSSSGGDTLIDVRCYEVYRYYVLFSTTTVVVEGKAVKLSGKRGK
jgi:hypothetical protein